MAHVQRLDAASAKNAAVGALAHAESSSFKRFSSATSTTIRAQKAQSLATASRATTATATATATATGATIYASTNPSCAAATANGTQANPYCHIQLAVNAAAPGDTVDVLGDIGYTDSTPVTVTTSHISIVGIGDQAWIQPYAGSNPITQPGILLDGVTGVTISNLMVTMNSPDPSGISVVGSSDVTIDSSYVTGSGYHPAISIDGASSNVTVSRTYVEQFLGTTGVPGIIAEPGAQHVVIADDVLSTVGIVATGVSGLDIVGDTIQRPCVSAIDVEGTSTAVYLENNLLEDANPGTDGPYGGAQSQCVGAGKGWAPDITVAAAAAGATTADYNDFYIYGSDGTAPYSWAGTTYATLAGFQTGTPQGSHDTLDTKEFWPTYLRPNESSSAEMLPITGSAAIGSANTSAPGEPTSDFFGKSPYNCRGAVQFVPTNPNMMLSLSGEDISASGVSVTATVGNATGAVSLDFDWGDGGLHGSGQTDGAGTATSTHSYHPLGSYTVTVTASDASGDQISNSMQVSTAGSDYTAYGPVRILDTRYGTGAPKAPLTSAAPIRVKVAGNGSIPTGITAVALNLTVTDATSFGNVLAYPDGPTQPATSNLNFGGGQTVANAAIVPVAADGFIDLAKQGPGSADVIADVEGYFTQAPGAGYTPQTPTRILDTRDGTGTTAGAITSSSLIRLKIGGNGGVPTGVSAVSLNLTAVDGNSYGDLIAYPDGSGQPTASNLNYVAGVTVANAAIVPVGTNGYIDIVKQGPGSVDVIADVQGYFSTGAQGAYLPVNPTRLFDSRLVTTNGPLPAGDAYQLGIGLDANNNTIDPVVNTTVTDATSYGYLTVFPDNHDGPGQSVLVPTASTLNFLAGSTVPNLTFATPSRTGVVDFYNGQPRGQLDLIVDLFGFFQNN